MLHVGNRLHEAAPNNSSWHIELRPHGTKQAVESDDITLTIIEQRSSFLFRIWPTPQRELAHGFFFGREHGVQTEVSERAEKAVPGWRWQPVCEIAEFGKQVENMVGQWPAKGEVAAEFRRGEVGDEE